MNEKDAQRAVTDAFIKADPTTIVLTPRVRGVLPDGTQGWVPGSPRVPQTFKLSLLAYDQRPIATVAGVERRVDYHLIGRHDSLIGVGDTWQDDGTTYEVIAFTEGFDYERKALVYRHVPPSEVI